MQWLRFWLGLAWMVVGPTASRAAVVAVNGDLLVEAARLEAFSRNPYGDGSNTYTAPLTAEWSQLRAAAAALLAGDYALAETLAAPLDYEVVHFQHTPPAVGFMGLRSVEQAGAPLRAWGTFLLNTNPVVPFLVEAPHPQADFRSPQLAAEIFVKSGARGLLLAGAHRHVNGPDTGDPCDWTNTIFHAVHEAWSGAGATNTAWQIHGFAPGGHPEFPPGTLAVLSTGQGGDNFMSTNVVHLDARLEVNGLKSYAYNRNLADLDALNLLVNEGVPGQTFTNLGARSNVQGVYSRGQGGTFVHVELATSVRTNAALRTQAADAVAAAMLHFRPAPGAPPAAVTLAPSLAAGAAVVEFTPTGGHPHVVEGTTNLATGVWVPVYGLPGQGLPRRYTNALGGPERYFRVLAE